MGFSNTRCIAIASGLLASALMAGAAAAATVTITITNNSRSDGLFLTPLYTAFHDGTYDTFSPGTAASAGLEAIAEEGDASVEIANNPGIKTAVITSPGGFAGAPVIDPGETATLTIRLDRFTENYFSYLSMVIPSNDTFIGNDDPMAHQIFDSSGKFTNIGPILIKGGNAWDAGTEVNNNVGAAFTGAPGVGTDENGVVHATNGLRFLRGLGTLADQRVRSTQGADGLLATITIAAVPVPAGLPLLGGGLILLGALRRRPNNG